MTQPNTGDFDRRTCRATATRFSRILLGMCLVIGLLVMLETFALWWIGAEYEPKWKIREVRSVDFSLSADGRWGASRIRIGRGATNRPPQWAILLHDMKHLDRTTFLHVGRSDPTGVAISPSGNHVAFTTFDGAVCLWSRHHTDEPLRTVADVPCSDLTWSPDGQILAAAGTEFVYLWTMPSGQLLHKLRHYRCNYLSFARDSRILLSAGGDTNLHLWDVPSGKLVKIISVPYAVSSVALSSDGRSAAFTAVGRLFVWDVERDEELWQKAAAGCWKRKVALSPDDAILATIVEFKTVEGEARKNRAVISYARTGQLVYLLDHGDTSIAGIRFAPDGTLCFWDEKGVILGWDLKRQTEAWRFSCLEWVSTSPVFRPPFRRSASD